MASRISQLLTAKRIKQLLKKNQIEVVHYLPGRIRLKSIHWIGGEGQTKMDELVQELEGDPFIHSVSYTKEIGTVLILFSPQAVEDGLLVEKWLMKVDAIHNLH